MKHSEEDCAALLVLLCSEIGIELTPLLAGQMIDYLSAVVEKNREINLTRIETMRTGIRLHLLDSLVALPEVHAALAGKLCDIGTGGGFPGVPLALATGRPCVALDSVGKKAAAVNDVLSALGMGQVCTALPERAEFHARHHGGQYAVVTARALAPLPSIVELAAPLLATGGTLIAFKGAPLESEIAASDSVASIVGLRRTSARGLVLPGGDERRMIVSYVKVGKPSVKLPRREGLAQHAPLA